LLKQQGIEVKEEKKAPDLSLIDMDVETLSMLCLLEFSKFTDIDDEQKKERKKQVFLQGQIEYRQRLQKEKDEKRSKDEADDKLIREEIEKDPQAWYQKMSNERQVSVKFRCSLFMDRN
jgi:hypothetical protein